MIAERPRSVTLRAGAVLPICSPLIRDAAVRIARNRIVEVCPWRALPLHRRKGAVELGHLLLLPGFVNAHCHLDYTHMAGQFPPPEIFTDWLKLIVSTKQSWSVEDYAQSWRAGADMLLRSGTTTVADIEAVPQLLPRMWSRTPLRVVSFLEMIGISKARPAGMVIRETIEQIDRLRPDAFGLGLSPHSPYSTSPELLRLSAQAARRGRLILTTHAAESQLEALMFCHARGTMYDWLQRSGRDMSDCGRGSPVKCLKDSGLLSRQVLVAHANYLSPGDATQLARRNVSVVHCPRSHFYFKHRRFPLSQLARTGTNICLGTDSLASVYRHKGEIVELDMFAEMRELARAHPELAPRRILRMATVNGARALSLAGKVGVLAKGALADIIALPLPKSGKDLYQAVVGHQGPVAGSMIDGGWALPLSRK